MSLPLTPVWFIALPLLLAFASPLWARLRLLTPLLLVTPAVLLLLAFVLLPEVRGAPLLETIVIAPPLGIHLQLDSASWLLVVLFSLAGVLAGAYLWLGDGEPYLRDRRAFILLLLLIAGCNGMVLTGDIFNLYVFLEIAGVSAYALAAVRRDASALEAGLKYLIVGSVAAIFFLFAVVLIYLQTGNLNLAAVAASFGDIPRSMQILIGLLMLVGLGIKAELFPFNLWVPDIYQGSHPVVAGLYSGVQVKAFLFVLFHLVFLLLAAPETVGVWLMGMGAATMLVAEIVALRQDDLRRMLSYSSLGQIGLIALALGFGAQATTAGGLFHMLNHTLVKMLLFLTAAVLLRSFLSARIADLAGAARARPMAGALFVLGALAVMGLPPLSGFASKLWILKGFAEAGVYWPVALILLAALIEAGYYFRWIKVLYAPRGQAQRAEVVAGESVTRWGYAPMLVAAGLIVLLGLAPALVDDLFNEGASVLLDRTAALTAVLEGGS